MKIDNTMLKYFEDCPLKYKTRIVDEWTSRFGAGPLIFGGGVHEGLKAWYQGLLDGKTPIQRMEEAIEAVNAFTNWDSLPIDDHRTKTKGLEMMLAYIKEYPSETFKVLQVEVPFCFELGRWILHCDHCGRDNDPFITGDYPAATSVCRSCGSDLEPIEYGGIFDGIIQYGAGSQSVVYTFEHKTTSQLGGLYFRQFDLDNQISGYCWAGAQVSGKVVGGALINVLCLTRGSNISFKREMIGRNPTQLEQWKNDVAVTCNEIALAQRTGQWQKRTNHCMNKYGLCTFHSVHVLADPEERRRRLETDYRKEPWDFERRDDTVTVAD